MLGIISKMSKIWTAMILNSEVSLVLLTIFHSLNGFSQRTTLHEKSVQSPTSAPEFWLDEYGAVDEFIGSQSLYSRDIRYKGIFEDDYLSKNGTDYILSENVGVAVFVCEAEYPIRISFPYPDVNEFTRQLLNVHYYNMAIASRRLSKLTPDLEEPISDKFRAYLALQAIDVVFLSTIVTCESIDFPKEFSSSVYLFVPKINRIERKGQTVQVEVTKRMTTDPVLPCRPSTPDMEISLFLQNNEIVRDKAKATWKKVPVGELVSYNYNIYIVSYNPKVGFTLSSRNQRFDNKEPIVFKCIVEESPDDEYVLVNVVLVEKLNPPQVHFEPIKVVKNGASVDLTGPQLDFQCCSGIGSKPPLIHVASCSNPVHCDLVKYTELWRFQNLKVETMTENTRLFYKEGLRDDCSVNYIISSGNPSTLVFCKGENLDYAGEFVTLRDTERNDTAGDDNREKIDVDTSTLGALKINQKMEILLAKPFPISRKESRTTDLQLSFIHSSGSFNSSLIFGESWSDSSTPIREFSTKIIYEEEIVHIICIWNKLFHSGGGHLRINWTKNRRTDVKVENNHSFMLYSTKKQFARDEFQSAIIGSEAVKAKLGMCSVECFKPIWNSTKWDKLTYEFSVLPSTLPILAGPEEETVYFELNEVGRELKCELLKGVAPNPVIIITKDGHGLLSASKNRSEGYHQLFNVTTGRTGNTTTFAKLSFFPISHEHHGTYQCIAKNVKGESVKKFKVLISTGSFSSRASHTIVFTFVGILLSVIVGVGLKFWFQKRKLKTLLRRQSSYVQNMDY